MSRFLVALGALLALLVVVGALVGLLAYGTTPTRSGRMTLEGLTGATTVAWSDDGTVVIEGPTESDRMAALGYAHAADHAWAMALWRQTAEGRLAAWFGPAWRGYDRHARLLGFAALARQTYDRLPEAERGLLDAYARGVNRAFAEAAVAQTNEFVLLDVEPEEWAPWHALAVERLIAWMGTPRLSSTTPGADSTLAAFARTDSLYRTLLRIDGARQSRAWTAALDSTGPTTVHQLAVGASALPLFQPVAFRQGGRSVLTATVPGTLMRPAGRGDGAEWAVFLTSTARLALDAGPPPPPVHDRLVDRDGNETLLVIHRDSTALYLGGDSASRATPPAADSTAAPAPATDSTAAPDSLVAVPAPAAATARTAVVIQWKGFAPGTDLSAWRALASGASPPAFRLFDGDGLLTRSEAGTTVLGTPAVLQPLPGGVYVAADSLARYAAAHLAARLTTPEEAGTPDRLVLDAYSPWAAGRIPGLLAALGHRDSLARDLKDPYAYLLSWDHTYDADAIGAALFETWMAAHESVIGSPPAPADSANRPLLQQTLRLAVAILKDRHGERPSAWRWANARPGRRVYPMADSAGATGGLPDSRYRAFAPERGGHPTALQVGPSHVFGEPPASNVWTVWSTSGGDLYTFAPDDPEGLAAATLDDPEIRPLLREARPATVLTLLPPDE